MFVPFQHSAKEWAASYQNHSVGLDLLVFLTHQGHIREVQVFSDIMIGTDNVCLMIVPLKAKPLQSHISTLDFKQFKVSWIGLTEISY